MNSYSWSYKLLHWLSAVLFTLMCFAFIGFDPQMSDADRIIMLVGHSSIGALLCVLILIRIGKRFVLKHPQPQHALPSGLTTLAKLTQLTMYMLMVLVPLTGFITANFHHLPVQVLGQIALNNHHDSALFDTFRSIHVVCIQSLIIVVVGHIIAALGHKFVLKDKVLYSMRPWFITKKPRS
ncbi:cytochrome b/b6 domain-containing protein [Pseudoalteromonas sp. SMS1]|uniref:cytochrome b n=1 Tax=Pseudoalteromonas sp. SMS1 TaxID=2908894 RepID=UPI001F316C79|nr:cytochrome b/b6 domain-containing protein [Pseudoalteromonas sp. SMS1]MCF2856669.1 cytochrome b/b6 domain-containing protein [Pseudoalteromonas sp. SMS1]